MLLTSHKVIYKLQVELQVQSSSVDAYAHVI